MMTSAPAKMRQNISAAHDGIRARGRALMARVTHKVASVNTSDLITTLAKYGVGSVIALWLVYVMTQGLSADVKGIRDEHQQMGQYLQAICLGVTTDPQMQWRCMPQHRGGSGNSLGSSMLLPLTPNQP